MDPKIELYRRLFEKYGDKIPAEAMDNFDLDQQRFDIGSAQSEQVRSRALSNKLMGAARGFGSISGKMPERQESDFAPIGAPQMADVERKQKVRDYLMGKFFETKRAASDKATPKPAALPKPPDTFRQETTLRKEFEGSPEAKQFKTVEDSYKVISSIEPSPAGDLSLIFSYMKMLDPGSTVREGEFANAQNAGSVPDRIYNMYNKIISGERLNDAQRTDFKNQAKQLYITRQKAYGEAANKYRTMGSQYKLNPEMIAPTVKTEPESDEKIIGGKKYKKVQGGWQEIP